MTRLACAALLFAFCAMVPSAAQESGSTRVIVKVADAAELAAGPGMLKRFTSSSLRAVLDRAPGATVQSLVPASRGLSKGAREIDRIVIVTFSTVRDARDAASRFAGDPLIEYAVHEQLLRVDAASNDSAWAGQWGAQRINAERAWTRTRGNPGVRIGVIDTGIDPFHPDLRGQLWINPAEDANGNGAYDPWASTESRGGVYGDFDGIDGDGNGIIDDVSGYDFTDQQGFGNAAGGDYRDPDPDIDDDMGHGTSVSGIIAAAADNSIGIAGVAPDCRLVTLRAFDARGVGAEGDVARALAYAAELGIAVVNMSFGDVQYSRVLRDMVRYAHGRGVVMVSSAGNSQTADLHYPSAYGETISVGATASNDILAGFSNYGQTVDLVAPGQDISTTERGGLYGSFNGTSASAPFVSGVAALVKSLHPDFGPDDIRGILVASARDLGAPGWDERYGAGLLDAERAVSMDNPTVVKILSPRTGFGSSGDTVIVVGTAASPYMTGFTVEYGMGENPIRWHSIAPSRKGQTMGDTIARWVVSGLQDTTYTIRLSARGSTTATLEDRVVIRIDRTAPVFLGVGFLPAMDGRHYGIAAGFITDEPTLARIWYRPKDGSEDWAWISAEGGTVNNLFVGTTHYAFLGEGVLAPERTFEFYLTATNETGLTSTARDGLKNFEAAIASPAPELGLRKKNYTLPPGRVFTQSTDFTNDGRPEALLNDYSDGNKLKILQHDGTAFRRLDAPGLSDLFPRGAGKLKGDGSTHLLASFVRKGYILESAAGGIPGTLVWADTASQFWPVTIADVTEDGRDDVLAVLNDSAVGIFSLNASNQLTRVSTIVNPTAPSKVTRRNVFNSPAVAIGDFNKNGRPDLLFGDEDGDFFIVEHRGGGMYQMIWGLESEYTDGGEFVAAGDFNGDGRDEFAIGLRTASDDVIPFWYFGIYSLDAQNRSQRLWSQQYFGVEDAGQFGAFTRIQNSLTAANLDGDAAKELIITAFPELYVVDFNGSGFTTAQALPLVNTNAAVAADFDGNGVAEFGIMTKDSILFYERDLPYTGPPPPHSLDVEYLTHTRARISWSAPVAAPRYRLYKGRDIHAMELFGEFTRGPVSDFSLQVDTPVVYGLTSYDSAATPQESPMIFTRRLLPHAQPRMDTAVYLQNGQVRVNVSQDLASAIPAVSSFLLDDAREPESVAMLGPRQLLLSFDLIADGAHGIRVRKFRDAEGIPFDEEVFASFDVRNDAAPACFIRTVEFLPPDGFAVWFSGALDSTSASIPGNYLFEPQGNAVSARFDRSAPDRVELRIQSSQPLGALGREYILKARGVRCATGELVPEGAGGTYALILNRENLDAMFVYPNPLRESDAQEFVTFANLTPRATIRIYTLSGLFLREVLEEDGNGGVAWDLRDEHGEAVPAGVYLYHATGRDAQGRDAGEKTGKFVIAR